MSFRYYANTQDSHHYNGQDVVVRRWRTLSTVSGLAFFSATIFDIPNIFLIVFSKHVLCSSIEAWTNSSMWSIKSATNEASSDFFFLHDLISGVVDDFFSEAESIWDALSIMGSWCSGRRLVAAGGTDGKCGWPLLVEPTASVSRGWTLNSEDGKCESWLNPSNSVRVGECGENENVQNENAKRTNACSERRRRPRARRFSF